MVRTCPWIWAAPALIALAACSSDRGAQVGPDTATAGASGTGAPATAGTSSSSLAGATSSAGMTSTAPARPAQAGTSAGSTNAGAAANAGTGPAAVGGSAGIAAGSGAAGASTGGASGGAAGAAGGGAAATAGRSGAGASAGRGGASAAGTGGSGATAGLTPVYRIPVRVHVGMSKLTDAELQPIFAELNAIWLAQAGVCFEIEVTTSETNRTGGFDFRYTSGTIPGASSANGVTQSAHSIWSIDHPRLNDVSMPVMNPTSRTTAHELGHALDLAHQNPPPSNDCSSPCYCAQLGDDCDEYLMRSGTKGFKISKPEVEISRKAATRVALPDQAPVTCGAPVFMR